MLIVDMEKNSIAKVFGANQVEQHSIQLAFCMDGLSHICRVNQTQIEFNHVERK